VRIECRDELSIQSEAACGTLIEAANQQFGFRLEYRNTQAGNTGGVAVAKRHVSNCGCIRICHCIARGLVNDAEVAVTMRQREFRSTKNGKIWCRQSFKLVFRLGFRIRRQTALRMESGYILAVSASALAGFFELMW
jgi:hypothetical protein